MDREQNQSDRKQPYEPPRITVISLRPEEAVLGHCKTSGAGGPGSSCSVLGLCPTQGS